MSERETECIFCKIVKGQLPSSLVYEDEKVIGLMDIRPVNPGHLLIIPKSHSVGLSEIHPDLGSHMFKVTIGISRALKDSSIRCEGVNLFLADGEAAGQDVFHIHLHVIPRFEGDGFGFKFDESYYVLPERKELDETAQIIRDTFARAI